MVLKIRVVSSHRFLGILAGRRIREILGAG
jgi:hypothetical protein